MHKNGVYRNLQPLHGNKSFLVDPWVPRKELCEEMCKDDSADIFGDLIWKVLTEGSLPRLKFTCEIGQKDNLQVCCL